tara:strand:- start:1399 stop:1641 length:243 start_codon:yes stop_codon:yes gene_type:complete
MTDKAYCLKCRRKNMEMVNTKPAKMKNGRSALKGKCKKCGTNMFKITGGMTAKKGGMSAKKGGKTAKKGRKSGKTRKRKN